jgi:hypothetical protein
MTDQIMTIKEVAEYLKLPGFKVGGSWRFKTVDLEAWIEKQKEKE